MHHEDSRKRLILTNALSRLRRAAIFAEPALRRRRQEILAVYCYDGQRCFAAMREAFRRGVVTADGDNLRATSPDQDETDLFTSAIMNFVAEPAQKLVIKKNYVSRSEEVDPGDDVPITLPASYVNFRSGEIGRLAWGAFSLKKIMYPVSVGVERPKKSNSIRLGSGVQLSLRDLSIIECAAFYQEGDFDHAFMRRLSDGGAAVVHRIAMIVVNDFSIRVDKAIVIAAKTLADPLVGGDADHCCSMLKTRQFPPSWAAILAPC